MGDFESRSHALRQSGIDGDAMEQRKAVITRIEGENIWVRMTEAIGGCGRCDEPGGCRSGLNKSHQQGAPEYMLRDRNTWRVGQSVLIEVDAMAPLIAGLKFYGFPVVGLVVGALLGSALSHREGLSIFFGFLGLLCGYFFGRNWNLGRKVSFAPRIIDAAGVMPEISDIQCRAQDHSR